MFYKVPLSDRSAAWVALRSKLEENVHYIVLKRRLPCNVLPIFSPQLIASLGPFLRNTFQTATEVDVSQSLFLN